MGTDKAIPASHARRADRGPQPDSIDIGRWVLLSPALLHSAQLCLFSRKTFSNSDVFSPLPPSRLGTDTHLVIRPLMEKVEVKNYDAALRKITFPHVSITP